MSESKLQIGFLGLGWVFENIWYPIFSELLPTAKFSGLDPFIKRQACTNFKQLDEGTFWKKKYDLVVIATPNNMHSKQALHAISLGFNVLIEKPVCLKRQSWQNIIALSKINEVLVFPSAAIPYRTDILYFQKIIRDSQLGQARYIEADWVRSRGIPGAASWFTNSTVSGGGVLQDLGWHLLDLVFRLYDDFPVEQYFATQTSDFLGNENFEANWKLSTAGTKEHNRSSIVPDSALLFLKFDSEKSARIRVGWASHLRGDESRLLLVCENGELELTTLFGFSPDRRSEAKLILHQNHKGQRLTLPKVRRREEYLRFAQSIINRIKRSDDPHADREYSRVDMICNIMEGISHAD